MTLGGCEGVVVGDKGVVVLVLECHRIGCYAKKCARGLEEVGPNRMLVQNTKRELFVACDRFFFCFF